MSITRKAEWSEIGYFLKGFRERRGEKLEDVNARFKALLAGAPRASEPLVELEAAFRSIKCPIRNQLTFLHKLEGGLITGPDLSRGSVRLLAEAYDLPALMLDPLFSQVLRNGESYLVDSTGKMTVANDKTMFYGENIEYRIPSRRLPDCPDVGFGHLTVHGGGRSDTHDHPGTELIFVLDGPSIEVRFDSSGLRIPLEKWEGAHFRSEIPHSIYNPHTEDTEGRSSVFVIRFYQLHTKSTWQKAIRIIEGIEGVVRTYEKGIKEARRHAENGKHNAVLEVLPVIPVESDGRRPYSNISPFVKSLTTRVSSADLKRLKDGQDRSVADPFGLSQMLERIKEQKKWTLDTLVGHDGFPKTKLSQILHASVSLTHDDLVTLGQQFKIESMLLSSFLHPSVPDVIALRKDDLAVVPGEWTGVGVKYRIPRCNLALSDMNLLILELDGQSETKVNEHPGFELLIPLTPDSIELEFFDESGEMTSTTSVCAARNEYAYYSSVNRHRIRNPGTDMATAFVVRFYGWSKA